MTSIDRRTMLKGTAAAAVGGPLAGFLALPAQAERAVPDARRLRPIPDLRDGVVRLHLPEGFQYRSFHDSSAPQTLNDGSRLPGNHDGMAAFGGSNGLSTLVRNHEVGGACPAYSTTAPVYDPMAPGGTSNAVVTGRGDVVDSWASLAGTLSNCSGGEMPWGTWITCEETINGPDVFDDFTRGRKPPETYETNARLTKPHGYCFEVPAAKGERASAVPIRNAGRFAHESVSYDVKGNALYITEDDFGFPSGFYKYVPPNNPVADGRIADGGKLYMLAVEGHPNIDLSAAQRRRATYKVRWVEIADPDPTFPMADGRPTVTNDQALTAVARQGWAQGAAYFSRLEGTVIDNGIVYFTATQGGGPPQPGPENGPVSSGYGGGYGQIWAYHCRSQMLQLLYESPNRETLDFPDNITANRRGTLVVCEDSRQDNFVRGLTRGGQLFDIALNRIAGRTDDEFAGSTFSDDDQTLFVNIQARTGMTFAIWGPWTRIGV